MTQTLVEIFPHAEAAGRLLPSAYSQVLTRVFEIRRAQRHSSPGWSSCKFVMWPLLPGARFPHEGRSTHLLRVEEAGT